jgi:predicted oxidoreductase
VKRADVVVVGAGIAGLVATLELLEFGRDVLLLDRCEPHELGGLAREAFGGTFMVDTAEQRRSRIKDSFELAWQDWQTLAGFDEEDVWPRRWAQQYVARARDEVGGWLKQHGVWFFPVVNWAERGMYGDGNSVPRFHLCWGCGQGMVDGVWGAIEKHPRRSHLDVRFRTRVTRLEHSEVHVGDEVIAANAIVIAAGGVGGNLDIVRKHWPKTMGAPPEKLLMGSHYYADGAMHEEVERLGGNVTHLDRMWNYADAVRHPKPRRKDHGVKLIPPRSGLLFNPDGKRYGPAPVMPTFDAYHALERMCEDERKYSWLVCNWKIAVRELDVSGSEHNPLIREKRLVRFVTSVVTGKPNLVRYFIKYCPDFVTADSLPELGRKMNELTGTHDIDGDLMASEVERYDANLARGKAQWNDDQIRRIAQLRNWRGDRLRTAKFVQISDRKAGPLIAVKLQPMARKSLGGIQTDLESRVLDTSGEPIPGLYAVGEAAGFGGGGLHGRRSLEGTFLGGCVFSARLAANAIAAS